jgi:hypothetical protein
LDLIPDMQFLQVYGDGATGRCRDAAPSPDTRLSQGACRSLRPS